MSVNLDFKQTFQYFQALYSVVRISSQLFHYNINRITVEFKFSDYKKWSNWKIYINRITVEFKYRNGSAITIPAV